MVLFSMICAGRLREANILPRGVDFDQVSDTFPGLLVVGCCIESLPKLCEMDGKYARTVLFGP